MKRLHWYDHLAINLFWLGLNIRNTAIGSILMPYLVAGFVNGEVGISGLVAAVAAFLLLGAIWALNLSLLTGAGAGMIGSGIGGPLADTLNRVTPGLGYAAIFACYGVLFVLSTVSLRWVKTKS